ncbi:mycofactocin precursor MftA [Saccharopolyspora hordei]|uniref:Mycofactocin n=1 Tax=Saccharopolyspora hordei TaxID=1838 RepID=A0A853AUL9_9PSEU|nr:mycofactocin precursor [Saccharopolyspora hordei]
MEQQNTVIEHDGTEHDPHLDVVEDLLVEEVSIDGMCGVY